MRDKAILECLPDCDMCKKPAAYDARIPNVCWAYVCEDHFKKYGCKLGVGSGQALIVPLSAMPTEFQNKHKGVDPAKLFFATGRPYDKGV